MAACYVKEESDLLFTPADGRMPYIRISAPYASASRIFGASRLLRIEHSYEHQGPYYGGPNLSYWYRLLRLRGLRLLLTLEHDPEKWKPVFEKIMLK